MHGRFQDGRRGGGGAGGPPLYRPSSAFPHNPAFYAGNLNVHAMNPNLYIQNAAPFLHNPNLFVFPPSNLSFQSQPSSQQPTKPSQLSQDLLARIESAVMQAKQEFVIAREHVSCWKVSQAALLSLQLDSWATLGLQIQEIPSLYKHMVTEAKINAFINCFVGVRRFTSVYELGVAACRSEGIGEFEDLGLGPLLRHPLVEHYFSVPPDMTEVLKITSVDITLCLAEFMDSHHKRYIRVDSFIDFLSEKWSVSAREQLGVRIQSLGMHIFFLKEARKSEERGIETSFHQLKHSFAGKTKKMELSQPLVTASQKEVLDSRFNYISERVKTFASNKDFRGKHIKFVSSSSEDDESNHDDKDESRGFDNQCSILQHKSSSHSVEDDDQHVTTCSHPSASRRKGLDDQDSNVHGKQSPQSMKDGDQCLSSSASTSATKKRGHYNADPDGLHQKSVECLEDMDNYPCMPGAEEEHDDHDSHIQQENSLQNVKDGRQRLSGCHNLSSAEEKERNGHDSNNLCKNPLAGVKDGEQRVSSCPYPSATEEMLRLGMKAGSDRSATPGSGKSDGCATVSTKKKRKNMHIKWSLPQRDSSDGLSINSEYPSNPHKRKKTCNGSLEEMQSLDGGSASSAELTSLSQSGDGDLNSTQLDLTVYDVQSFIKTWSDICKHYSLTEVFCRMLEFYRPKAEPERALYKRMKKRMRSLFLSNPCMGLLNVAVQSMKRGMWSDLPEAMPASGDDGCTNFIFAQTMELAEMGPKSERDTLEDKLEDLQEAVTSAISDVITTECSAYATLCSDKFDVWEKASGKKRNSEEQTSDCNCSLRLPMDIDDYDMLCVQGGPSSSPSKRRETSGGSIEDALNSDKCDVLSTPEQVSYNDPLGRNFEMSENDLVDFITTWKASSQQFSATELIYRMLFLYKRKGSATRGHYKLLKQKIQSVFSSNPGIGLLNVAVASMKQGMWDSLDGVSKIICQDVLANSDTAQPVEMQGDWSMKVGDTTPHKTEDVPGLVTSATVDDILRKLGDYFDCEHVKRMSSQVNLHLGETFEVFREIRSCELWLTKQFAVADFSSLGHGDFLEFLTRQLKLLPFGLRNLLVGHDQQSCSSSLRISMPPSQLLVLLSQARRGLWGDNVITNRQISLFLERQFPLISFDIARDGPEEDIIDLITKQQNSDPSIPVLFSASLLGNYGTGESFMSNRKQFSVVTEVTAELEPKSGCLGSVSSSDALECLLKAPMLSDLFSWSHWDLIYAPSLGPLLEWLLKQMHTKDLLCILTRDGRLIRIDPFLTADSFLDALVKGSSYQAAVSLVSLLALYKGTKNIPLSLLKCYAVRAFEVMKGNSTGITEDGNGGETPRKKVFVDMDLRGSLPNGIYESFCNTDKAINIAVRFFIDCLTYLPSEFRSFAADILVSGLNSFIKNSPTVILHQCNQRGQRLMLHDIGLSLGILEWIDDFRTFSAGATSSSVMATVSKVGDNVSLTSFISMKERSKPGVCTLLTNDNTAVSMTESGLFVNEYREEICKDEVLSDVSSQKKIDDLNSLSENEQEAANLIESIRKDEFGLDPDLNFAENNLLRKQHARLGRALQCLSQELYSQDSHFLLELVQNADDNMYPENVEPTLVFILQSTGIVVLNNEQGFSAQNIRALCDVGNSTKKGSGTGYIGHKGIGFKSVFRVTDAPEIHSNGFHVKFDTSQGHIGFVLPTGISPCDISSFTKLFSTKSDQTVSWNTCIVLPFRTKLKEGADVASIVSLFSDLHPSLLLFLHRLRCIKFKNTLDESLTVMKRVNVGNGIVNVCHGNQKMSWLVVRSKLHAAVLRPDVQATEIAIAFTLEESTNGEYKPHLELQPVFAFLPLRTYGLKFILQGDFVLPSSREEVDGDRAWNQWLLSEFPSLFVSAEKSFCGIPCFEGSPGKAVTVYMSFVPLPGEVHGFFSFLPHMIIAKLRTSNCLLLEGPMEQWVPPCRVLRGWNEEVQMLLPENLLHRHLGLGYLNEDIILSDSLAEALGIQNYGPQVLVEFILSVCRAEGSIKPLGLEWLSSWLTAFFNTMSAYISRHPAAERECDFIKSVREIPFVPLSDGSFGRLADGPIWLPFGTLSCSYDYKDDSMNFPKLYAQLRTVNPELLSAATSNAYKGTHVDTVRHMLTRIGVQQLSAHEVIRCHILPALSGDITGRGKHLMVEYLSFIMLHFQSVCTNCQTERAVIISELKSKSIILTNHGYKCPLQEPIHFGKEYGNTVDMNKLIAETDMQWHEVDNLYQNYQCFQSLSFGQKKWREFLQELGVTDFVQVISINKNVSQVSDCLSPDMMRVVGDSSSCEMVVEDWESPELVHLILSLSAQKSRESCKYLLEILDSMWDDCYNMKVAGCVIFKPSGDSRPIESSFIKSIRNLRWMASSIDEELHYPRDLFYWCEEIHSTLGNNVPYAVPKILSEALLNAIGFKTQVANDDMLSILQQWKMPRTPFRASIAQMSKFYNCIWNAIAAEKKLLEEFRSGSFIFVPHANASSNDDIISGLFLSVGEVYWQDPTGCVDYTKEVVLKSSFEDTSSSNLLACIYPSFYDFFVNVCGVPKIPHFCCYLQILLELSRIALPSDSADAVFQVLLKWADDIKSGLVRSDDILCLKDSLSELDNKVLPTVHNRWVSLHSSYGLVCWSDDDMLLNQFKNSWNIDFLDFGKLNEEKKESLSSTVCILLNEIGVPALSKIVSRDAIIYGKEDSTRQALHVNWILPYAQRYLYKLHPSDYAHLKQSGYEVLTQLQVAVVEQLYYRYTIKSRGITPPGRFGCSCLLQGNMLYVTRAADSHSLFLELTRVFFNGTTDLHLANFLHMVTTMAESGSTQEQMEFFIVNSQQIPKLPDEEIPWSFLSLVNGNGTSENFTFPEKILLKAKSKLGSWPPSGWKTAPDLYSAQANQSIAKPVVTTYGTEGIIHTEWQVPADLSGNQIKSSRTATASPSNFHESKVQFDNPLLVGQTVSVRKAITSNSEAISEPVGSSSLPVREAHLPTFTTRDQLLLSMPDRNQASVTGRLGELVAYKYFVDKYGEASVRWVNEENETGLPFDLVIEEDEENKEYIEVKATKSRNKDWFRITSKEWLFAAEKGDSFSVAHVVLADPANAKITIFKNPLRLCQQDALHLAVLMPQQRKVWSSIA